MIYFVFIKKHRYTMNRFFDNWAPEMRSEINLVFFEDIYRLKEVPAGCYIFADLERLDHDSKKLIHGFRRRLDELGDAVQILNDPFEFLDRYTFLKKLKEAGINDFDVHRCRREAADSFQYPVFFRALSGHGSTEIELHHDAASFVQAYDALEQAHGREFVEANFLIIEYLDTANEDGVFRKYSYMKIGRHMLPRHIIFSQNWVVKYPDLIETAQLDEETRFLDECPDSEEIDAIFKLTGIDHGRIDYSYDRAGKIQVWEINTNPNNPIREDLAESRLLIQESAMRMTTAAYLQVSKEAPTGTALSNSFMQRLQWWRFTKKRRLRKTR